MGGGGSIKFAWAHKAVRDGAGACGVRRGRFVMSVRVPLGRPSVVRGGAVCGRRGEALRGVESSKVPHMK